MMLLTLSAKISPVKVSELGFVDIRVSGSEMRPSTRSVGHAATANPLEPSPVDSPVPLHLRVHAAAAS